MRIRRTSAEIEEFHQAIVEVAEELMQHVSQFSVRQLFYRCTVKGVVEKTERGARQVQEACLKLREADRISEDWFVDSGRTVSRRFYSDASPSELLIRSARAYYTDPWKDHPYQLEIWVEKEALLNLIEAETWDRGVVVRVMRGCGSRTAAWRAASDIANRWNGYRQRTRIYQLGDYDSYGQDALQAILETTYDLMGKQGIKDVEEVCEFYDLAVTEDQIKRWNLPTRPAKEDGSRRDRWGKDFAVELDSIDPPLFKKLIRDTIEQEMPESSLLEHKLAMEGVQEMLGAFVWNHMEDLDNLASDHTGLAR